MSTYSNAHAKVKNGIFHFSFPGNWFELGIIGNDFSSFTIWAIQIQVSFTAFKNRKNPGIQPIHIIIIFGRISDTHEIWMSVFKYLYLGGLTLACLIWSLTGTDWSDPLYSRN